MSTTKNKRPLAQALADAEAFRDLFPPDCYERWEFAGSLRRKRPEVGDVEHVIVPKFGDVDESGELFARTVRKNLLWYALDTLVTIDSAGLTKHVYEIVHVHGERYRWGEKYRGVDFRGFNHELFTATPDNFGAIFLIRTGPADFSRAVVERMKRGGMYRQQDGQTIHVASGKPVATPEEIDFARLADFAHIAEPENRQ